MATISAIRRCAYCPNRHYRRRTLCKQLVSVFRGTLIDRGAFIFVATRMCQSLDISCCRWKRRFCSRGPLGNVEYSVEVPGLGLKGRIAQERMLALGIVKTPVSPPHKHSTLTNSSLPSCGLAEVYG